MKNLIFFLSLVAACSMITIQASAEQVVIAATDSSHTEPSLFPRQSDSNSKTVQSLNQLDQLQNPDFNCKAFLLGSTFPGMKIFVPDSSLTGSMPVFKPGNVDPGMLVPCNACSD